MQHMTQNNLKKKKPRLYEPGLTQEENIHEELATAITSEIIV